MKWFFLTPPPPWCNVIWMFLFLLQLPVPDVRTKRSEFIQPQSPQRPPQVATISQSPFCEKQYYPGQWYVTAMWNTKLSLGTYICMYVYVWRQQGWASRFRRQRAWTPLFLTQEQMCCTLIYFCKSSNVIRYEAQIRRLLKSVNNEK